MSERAGVPLTQEEKCSAWAAAVSLFGSDIEKLADKIVLSPAEKTDMAKMMKYLKTTVKLMELDCTPMITRP